MKKVILILVAVEQEDALLKSGKIKIGMRLEEFHYQ